MNVKYVEMLKDVRDTDRSRMGEPCNVMCEEGIEAQQSDRKYKRTANQDQACDEPPSALSSSMSGSMSPGSIHDSSTVSTTRRTYSFMFSRYSCAASALAGLIGGKKTRI